MAGALGGLIGKTTNNFILNNSYSTGNVIDTNIITGFQAIMFHWKGEDGGLIGSVNNSTINNSYSTGNVNGVQNVGGLVGFLNGATINNSYSIGQISGTTSLGGFVGGQNAGIINNSFWNTTTTGQSSGVGSGTGTATTLVGKTATEFADSNTFSSILNTNIWSLDASDSSVEGYQIGISRPYLKSLGKDSGINNLTLFSGGLGSSNNPYTITNWTQLQNINNSNILSNNYYFKLLNNLSSSTSDYTNLASSSANGGSGWNPIGGTSATNFKGNFNGQDYVIDGLYINRSASYAQALFGFVSNSIISNIGVTNVNITGQNNSAALVGVLGYTGSSTINYSYSSGIIHGTSYVGGLVGLNNDSKGIINNSYSTANVQGIAYIGGLVGLNDSNAQINNSFASGTIRNNINNQEGGLIGYNQELQDFNFGGGFLIHNDAGIVRNSFWNKDLTINGVSSGNTTGMIGLTSAELKNITKFLDAGWNISADSTLPTSLTIPTLVTNNGVTSWVIPLSYVNYFLSNITNEYTYNGTAHSLSSIWNPTSIFGSNYSSWIAGTDYVFKDSSGNTITGFTNAGTYNGITIDILKSGFIEATSGNTNGSLVIAKKDATVIANSDSKVYNGTTQSVSGFTATGLVNNETTSVLSGITGATASGINAGTYNTHLSGSDTNYNLTFVDGSLVIAKKDATVTANSDSKVYNGTTQSVSGFTATGLVNNETTSVLNGITGATASGTNVGEYLTNLSGTDTNYNLAFVNGKLKVNVKPTTAQVNLKTSEVTGIPLKLDGILSSELVSQGAKIVVLDATNKDVTELAKEGKIQPGKYSVKAINENPNYALSSNEIELTINPALDPTSVVKVQPIVVEISVPKVEVKSAPVQLNQNMGLKLGITESSNINLVSQTVAGQPNQVVTLSDLKSQSNSNSTENIAVSDVKVPLNQNSVIQLVNGGVSLPTGVDQQFYVVKDTSVNSNSSSSDNSGGSSSKTKKRLN